MTKTIRRSSPVPLTVLSLALLATAAAAQQVELVPEPDAVAVDEPQRAFGLHLDAALEPGDLEPVAAAAEPVQLAVVPFLADSVAWSPTHPSQASLQQTQGSGGGRFGRWLKKRWYIPVLAAVVVGVTLADDSGGPDDDD